MNDLRYATISNNFMFRIVMEKPELCRQLLERVLDVEIADISYPEGEKSLEAQLSSKGIRLDIYVTLADGTIIDVEMQTADSSKAMLAKRTRYYQSVMDNDALKKGEFYSKLRKTIIIFICTFDPFDRNFSKYTFSTKCHEDGGLSLEDDVYKFFINTHGDRHRISMSLSNLMDYINGSEPSDEFTRQLQEEVELQRDDEGKKALYMTFDQTLMEREEIGLERGKTETRIESIKNLMETMSLTAEQAMKALKIPSSEFAKYMSVL